MKQCSRCKENKNKTEFYKDKRTKDGLYASCRKCHNLKRNGVTYPVYMMVRDNPSPLVVARHHMHGIGCRLHSNPWYKDIKCLFSLDQLQSYFEEHWDEYMKVYSVWKENNFRRKYAPSLDRLDSKKDYKLSNIRIVPHHINSGAAHKGRKQTEAHKKAKLIAMANYFKNRKLT